ncbi:hypothetical protein ACQBAR_06440 [Propionibacteriaceae bacterium Y1685]|uniref:hypothetical protein n=1 Tax=Microlunatus sp. Y1700 TaxID=3418487 RepID=UPI003B78ECF4
MVLLPRSLRPGSSVLSPVDREGLKSTCRSARLMSKVLSAVRSGEDLVVALPTHLAVGAEREWTLIGWDQIEKGTWNADTSTISFELTPTDGVVGVRRSYPMREPGRFPAVFKDRVNSTIVFQRHLPGPGGRSGLTISARRDLATGQLDWRTTLGKGLRMSDPGVRELAEAALTRFRNEYDI